VRIIRFLTVLLIESVKLLCVAACVSIPHLKPAEPLLAKPYHFSSVIQQWDGSGRYDIALVGIPFDAGGTPGARYAPRVVREALRSLTSYDVERKIDVEDVRVADFGDIDIVEDNLGLTLQRVKDALARIIRLSLFTIVLGGDQTATAPGVEALRTATPADVALVYVDPEGDVEEGGPTRSSGVLRHILDASILEPKRVLVLGLRSFSTPRSAIEYFQQKGVRFLTAVELRRGLQGLREALNAVTENAEAVFVSWDLRTISLPPLAVTGIPLHLALSLMNQLCSHPFATVLHLAEYSPLSDPFHAGAQAAALLTAAAVAARFGKRLES